MFYDNIGTQGLNSTVLDIVVPEFLLLMCMMYA